MYESFQYLASILTIFFIILTHKSNLYRKYKFYIFGILSAESFTLFLFFAVKFSRILSLCLFLVSSYFLYATYSKDDFVPRDINKQNFVIRKITFDNFLIPLFPIIGFSLVILYLLLEFFVFDSNISAVTSLGIIHGIIIMTYNYIPSKYREERDFIFFFFSLFILTYLIPHGLYKIANSSAGSTDSVGYMEHELVYFLLSKPLIVILNNLGIVSTVDPNLGTIILFSNLETGTMTKVGITSGCSGIYSVYIFTCTFISFYLDIALQNFNIKIIYILV